MPATDPETDEIPPLPRDGDGAASAAPSDLVARQRSVYRQIASETPQWLATLHAAVQAGEVALTPAALGDLKALALAHSGAGEAAWRLLHSRGDEALRALRLGAGVANLVALLRLVAAPSPPALPDVRFVDALCDDDGDHGWRELPAAAHRLPASVLASAQRALRRQAADFSDADVGLRSQVRQVIDWALAERGDAGTLAVRCGWPRLARIAREWMEDHPGFGAPSALPLRVRARHLEAVQLRTPLELELESMRMLNCLDSDAMAADLRRPDRAFFSIRARASRETVADLELAYWPRSRRWAIDELKGYANQPAEPDVRAFARALCASVSPRLTLRFPKMLQADVAAWADAHPDPRSARLAARFALVLARGDINWLAPFITRLSRHRGAQYADTVGDALLAAWRKEFAGRAGRERRATDGAHRLRLLRLPSDERNQPHCLFDFGSGPRAIALRADGDGRLGLAVEVLDPACIARWLQGGATRPEPGGLQPEGLAGAMRAVQAA
jgi:hypothetical protein